MFFAAFVLATIQVTSVASSCPNGTYFNEIFQICVPCRRCLEGSVIKKPCSAKENTKCGICLNGTFLKSKENCNNCSICPQGSVVAIPCNSTMDTVCRKILQNKDSNIVLYVVIPAAILIIAIIAAIIIAVRLKRQRRQRANTNEVEMLSKTS